MPNFLKTIKGSVISETTGSVQILSPIVGEIQNTDYINMSSFTAYLQNLSKVDIYTGLSKPIIFGLQSNKIGFSLEISY